MALFTDWAAKLWAAKLTAFLTQNVGATAISWGGLTIGAQPTGASPGQIEFVEAMRYDHELGVPARANALNYLKAKYGL